MQITAELSFYPLTGLYNDKVIQFIRALRENQSIKIHTGGMSTLIQGDFDVVYDLIKNASRSFMADADTNVFVVKYLNKDAFDTPKIP